MPRCCREFLSFSRFVLYHQHAPRFKMVDLRYDLPRDKCTLVLCTKYFCLNPGQCMTLSNGQHILQKEHIPQWKPFYPSVPLAMILPLNVVLDRTYKVCLIYYVFYSPILVEVWCTVWDKRRSAFILMTDLSGSALLISPQYKSHK